MAGHEYFLGLDLGSVSLSAAAVDRDGKVLWSTYHKVQGRSRDAVISLCSDLLKEWMLPQGLTSFAGAMTTGSGKERIQELLEIGVVNEIVAHGTAASRFVGGRASVIEIGGQDSKFILVDDKGAYDYSMNELCAAGTGAFLDVQAERLGLTIEELSTRAESAEAVPPMAGRCSVFAKSDIIHLQQRGVPTDQIVAGLCYALARNYVATLIRGREIIKPVVFQGGVALNNGVLRAFRDILGLEKDDSLRPEMPHMSGAIGAAVLSKESGVALDMKAIQAVAAQQRQQSFAGNPIATEKWQLEATAAGKMKALESFEILEKIKPGEAVFIGLDIGSISTNAVALSAAGSLVAKVYIFTAGKPAAAAKKALGFLAGVINEPDIAAIGVTGSGRKLVGHAVGADLVIDEITAQAKGAAYGSAHVDTVIEIGGQDAKFIKVEEDGSVIDFEMNRVCSAGTGSFIQEQAVRLGVDLQSEFSKLALNSQHPLPFASRCTVFMESDLVHHLQQGVSLDDLLMGVSQAVVENYIDRVVQGRKFGRQIVIQGGVAMNRSVVHAFTARLKESQIVVHPHPGVSGAIGMALLTREKFHIAVADRSSFATSFKGLDFPADFTSSSFSCKGCENRCEVSRFHFKDGIFHFGDLCGKYSEGISGIEPGKDYTAVLTDAMSEVVRVEKSIAEVGVPRALLFFELYPFWREFFAQLSIQMKVSGSSGSDTMSLALARMSAETCLPVKCLFGHVASLEKEGIASAFIPSVSQIMDGMNCPYVQYGVAMIQANFTGIKPLSLPLVPGLPEKEKERLAHTVAELFGVDSRKVGRAYGSATRALDLFRKKTAFVGRPAMKNKRPLAVLLGKPYNIGDRFVNMSLGAKLAKAGFDVIAVGQLAIPDDLPLPRRYNNITWAFSRRMLKAAIRIAKTEDMYPVMVGNFGCGPDTFTFPLLQEIFENRPSLFLEFDEHRADAGLATRVEAFAQRVAHWRAKEKRSATRKTGKKAADAQQQISHSISRSEISTQYIIPYFSDHAKAFAGAIEAKGFKARVLPPPDHRAYEAGVEFSGGKQCHPFQLIAGDLVNLARTGNLPEGARYLLPTVETSCLITQYVPTIQLYMNSIGRGDVKVINTNSIDLLHRFGPVFVFNLGKAILGIEYLSRLRFERRPYEVEKGSVDKAYFAGLETIYQRQVEEKTNQGIMEAASGLASIPTVKRGTKPVIAIAGDAYTRVNQSANGGLFELLEGLGCEVWLSPTMVDIIMTGQEILARQYWEAGKTLDMMSSWGRVLVNNLGAGSVMKNFEGLLANFKEPGGAEVLRYTDGLLPGEPELLVLLNVAKHVDFANKGVDGILNVYCLNCLVGTATTSIFKGLAARTFGAPMMPLVFDAMGGTHVQNRVEAFVHRVKRNREERLGAGQGRVPCINHAGRLKEFFDRKLFDVRISRIRLPEMKMPDLKSSKMHMPSMKFPSLKLPEDLWGLKKKK